MPIGPYFRHLSISVDWLTSQARYVRVGFPRRTLPRFIWFTMPSLSQALLLEDLPSSHSAFQGHAAHTARWPAMLRPKGSWGACTPHGIIHSSTVLHGADLYTPRYCYISPLCFTAQRKQKVRDRVSSVWCGVGPRASCPDLGTKYLPRTARWRRIPRIPDCLSRPGTPAAPPRTALTTDTTAQRPVATHADNRCCRPWACTSVVRAGPHGCAP